MVHFFITIGQINPSGKSKNKFIRTLNELKYAIEIGLLAHILVSSNENDIDSLVNVISKKTPKDKIRK